MNNENIEIRNTSSRRFCVGDIHGAYKALVQVLAMAGFDYDNDELISLGDVADSWPHVPEVFDELLKIKNLVYVIGNHDVWLLEWFISKYSYAPDIWTQQGGHASIKAYQSLLMNSEFERIESHMDLLQNKAVYYHIDTDNNLFVHGGFNWKEPIAVQYKPDLTWDRRLAQTAYMWQKQHDRGAKLESVKDYNEVFIGHTTTSRTQPDLKPVHASNVWNLDQGAGYEGKLTLMNIDTKEYFQSDNVNELYPGVRGRY